MKPENESSVAVQVRFGTWAGQCDFLPKGEVGGGINLASQGLIEFEAAQTNALMRPDVLAHPMLRLSLSEAAAWVIGADIQPPQSPEDGNCLIGLSVALGIEAAMAIGIYGIWRVWHLI